METGCSDKALRRLSIDGNGLCQWGRHADDRGKTRCGRSEIDETADRAALEIIDSERPAISVLKQDVAGADAAVIANPSDLPFAADAAEVGIGTDRSIGE